MGIFEICKCIVFKTNEPEKASEPRRRKTLSNKQAENGTIHRLKSRRKCHCNTKARSVLILRPDLRFRALFANQFLQKLLGNELELLTMKLLVLWNLISPCLRVRAFISGHKQGVICVGGLCLLVSITLNMMPYVVNMVILGSSMPFLIPTFLVFNAALVLLVKVFNLCFVFV